METVHEQFAQRTVRSYAAIQTPLKVLSTAQSLELQRSEKVGDIVILKGITPVCVE